MIGLSPSTYYYQPKRSRASREREDVELRNGIEAIQQDFPRAGYRTVQVYLRRQGRWVGERRIRRIMKQFSLHAEIKRAFVHTTDSNHSHRVYPNLLPGRCLTGINQAWVADLTYIRIVNCFVYLAVILDLFSRKVIGWPSRNISMRRSCSRRSGRRSSNVSRLRAACTIRIAACSICAMTTSRSWPSTAS